MPRVRSKRAGKLVISRDAQGQPLCLRQRRHVMSEMSSIVMFFSGSRIWKSTKSTKKKNLARRQHLASLGYEIRTLLNAMSGNLPPKNAVKACNLWVNGGAYSLFTRSSVDVTTIIIHCIHAWTAWVKNHKAALAQEIWEAGPFWSKSSKPSHPSALTPLTHALKSSPSSMPSNGHPAQDCLE